MEDKMEDNAETPVEESQDEAQFEMSPEQATNMGGANAQTFNRKRVLIVLCISFAVVIGGGVIVNLVKSSKKNASTAETELTAGSTPSEFLNSLQSRALSRRASEPEPAQADQTQTPQAEPEPLLPAVSWNSRPPEAEPVPPPPSVTRNQPPPQNPQQAQTPSHFRSPLVPPIQGSLFASQGTQQNAQPQAAAQRSPMDDYLAAIASRQNAGQPSNNAQQNDQQNKQAFYDPSSGGAAAGGQFLGGNSVWTGTVIPGILETAVNTDLPGNVLARVTQNIFDSQTGLKLLIPQGTLLLARYNSSISYAQHRVQIVWDTMIRPDGFQLDLEGANGVDKSGMSGQLAKYSENWFEYLKAAGIITLFSVANARMTESAAQHATEESASNIAEANAELVNKLGGSLADRAMNIQPTLTVDNGTLINVMLNKTLYLPPIERVPAGQKYFLE
jgi:type IV secretion system protein VirB10